MNTNEHDLQVRTRNGVSAEVDAPSTMRASEPIEAIYSEVPPRQLRDYLRVFFKHRWLAAACFFAIALLAALVTWQTPKEYSASVRLQVARSSPIQLQLKENVLNLDETERILNGASSFVSTQVQALKSRDLAERVIRRYRLDTNPAFLHPGRERNGLAALAAEMPDILLPRNFTPLDPEPLSHDSAEPETEARMLDRYVGYLDVQDARGTDLIDIRFTTPNPSLSALLAAAHVTAFLEANQEVQLATDSRAMNFLGQQLEQSRDHLAQAETSLSTFASGHPYVALNQEQELIGRQIGEMSSLVTGAEGERIAAETRYEFLKHAKDQPLEHFLDGSEALRRLRLALLDVEGQRAALKVRLGPNHSQMTELRRQAAELRVQLGEEVDQEVAVARARYDAARLKEDELRRKLTKLEATAIEQRNLGAQYNLLKGEVESARSLHESLLRQRAETGVHSELDSSKVRIIERPDVPRGASRPRPIVNMGLGLLGGMLVALFVVFLRESLDNSVKSSDDLQGLVQLPTLAIVPNFALARSSVARRPAPSRNGNGHRPGGVPAPVGKRGSGNGDGLVMLREPWSPAAESYRHLRTAVLFSTPDQPKAILVTSASAGEGKTVTATNLAVAVADAGARVALLDVDLRDPGCHHVLAVDNKRGLSTLLTGHHHLEDVLVKLDTPRLAFVPAGPMPPNPAELVGSQRMATLVEQLRNSYDFVIIDSPPVLPVTDAVILGHFTDAVVLVMNGQKAPRELVRRARDQLAQAGANVIGVVVNNAGLHWGSVYLYHGYDSYRRAPLLVVEEPSV